MTLIELLVDLLFIALGVVVAIALFPIGGYWLAIPGFFAGLLVIPALMIGYEKYRKWAYLGDDWMPPCICGSREFKFEPVGQEYHLLCQQCRTRYEARRGVVGIFDANGKKPYKRLVRWKGWV